MFTSCIVYVNSIEYLNTLNGHRPKMRQVAQLSQRQRAAGCVSFGRKVEDWNWETIFYGHYRSIFNHCDIIALQSKATHREFPT